MRALVLLVGLMVGVLAFTFDGTPAAPQPFTTHSDWAAWDTIVHSRDYGTWANLDTQQAEHGSDCSAPPATHENHTYEGANFICNNHLMTAINAGGYGVIYLTPSQMLDWTNGPATLTFDMSTHKSSSRDWVDVWFQDFNGNLALPLEGYLPDLQSNTSANGNNQPAGHQYLHVDTQGGGKSWRNASSSALGPIGMQWWVDWAADSAVQRDTFQLTIDGSGFSMCKITGEPAPVCWADHYAHGLTVTKMTVTIGHHSYNPTKDGAGVPNTWHWDNVVLSPSVPFTLIHAAPNLSAPLVRLEGSGVVNFAAPAPTSAYLRFGAVGVVTLNGQVVQPVKPTTSEELANNYFVPIPVGSTSATISLAPATWYQGPFMAEGFSVWSQGGTPPSPTPTPTVTPQVPTPTPLPFTPTPSPTATSTPTQVPSSTPTFTPTVVLPTATPTRTPTPTATPVQGTLTPTPCSPPQAQRCRP